MALTKCQECGREISELAQACPGCGAPGPLAERRPHQERLPGEPVDPWADEPEADAPHQTLDEIRAAWRAEGAGGAARSPAGPPAPIGFDLGKKWEARKTLYIFVGVVLVASFVAPAVATTVLFAGIVYWTANQLLAPGGGAASAPAETWGRRAYEAWRGIGLIGRVVASVIAGLAVAFAFGALGR